MGKGEIGGEGEGEGRGTGRGGDGRREGAQAWIVLSIAGQHSLAYLKGVNKEVRMQAIRQKCSQLDCTCRYLPGLSAWQQYGSNASRDMLTAVMMLMLANLLINVLLMYK